MAVDRFDQFVHSLPRAIVTVLFAAGFVYFTAVKIVPAEAFVATGTAVILWWFRSRDESERNQKVPPSTGPDKS